MKKIVVFIMAIAAVQSVRGMNRNVLNRNVDSRIQPVIPEHQQSFIITGNANDFNRILRQNYTDQTNNPSVDGIIALGGSIADLARENGVLASQIAGYQKTITDTQSELAIVQERFKNLQTENAKLSETNSTLAAKASTYATKLMELEKKVNELNRQTEGFEEERKHFLNKTQEQQKKAEEQQKKAENAFNRLQESKYNGLINTTENKDKEIAEIKAKNELAYNELKKETDASILELDSRRIFWKSFAIITSTAFICREVTTRYYPDIWMNLAKNLSFSSFAEKMGYGIDSFSFSLSNMFRR